MPASARAISPLTLATARVTPLPCQRRPTSTSTVGLPRLSRIWRAWTRSTWLTLAGGFGARFRGFVLLAVGHHVGRAAIRFCSPLRFEFFDEARERFLLLLRGELRFDRRLGLRE